MRKITASEVRPGMTVKFDMDGWHVEGTVSRVEHVTFGLDFYSTQGLEMTLGEGTPVTVLAEPQPEEPTEFGAKARVRDRYFLRIGRYIWFEKGSGSRWAWDDLCEMGPVTVIPDQGWTAPDDALEVPKRIEEWPEDDEHLREHKWCDRDGYRWTWIVAGAQWECRDDITDKKVMTDGIPADGPWVRDTDA